MLLSLSEVIGIFRRGEFPGRGKNTFIIISDFWRVQFFFCRTRPEIGREDEDFVDESLRNLLSRKKELFELISKADDRVNIVKKI